MADNINNISRKRKSSDFYNNIGVDDLECSPSNSPEPEVNISTCSISETEISQTSTDINVNQVLMQQEEVSISLDIPAVPKTDDLRCMDMEVDNSPVSNQDVNKPFLSLIFHDNEFADIYKSQIVNHIKNLVSFELIEECKRETDTIINLWECPKQTVIENEKIELFSVDTTPSKGREIVLLPKYSTNNSNVIEELDPNKPNGNAEVNTASTLVCFNCDGKHAMRDCKEVKDYRRINMARNKYMANAPSKTTRYHLDDEQKYKHLVPGRISEKLKKALNIRKHEVPSYIYRMRMFGYPPGWLEEARVTNSSLELFDFQGCSVEESCDSKKVIDVSKIIEYPGFNVPLEKGDMDDYKYYRCPAYSEQFSKKTMLEYIEKYTESQKETISATINETPPNKCEPDTNTDSQESVCTDQVKRPVSPTLNDLELRKRQLLAELEDGCINSPQPAIIEPNVKQNIETNDVEVKTTEIKDTKIEDTEVNDAEIIKDTEIETPSNNDVIESPSVVSSIVGTPILKTASPFLQLPDRDKWSKDISQVINFENLPNATGKYEQMNKVISKVRNIVKGVVTDEEHKS